jgi:hypothetical protein
MDAMTDKVFDLRYDPNEVGGDLVVECWISHGPRAEDPDFDPQASDTVLLWDEEEPPVRGRVVRRDGNRVWVQIDLAPSAHAVA